MPATPAESRGPTAVFPVGLRVVRKAASFAGNTEPSLAEVMADEVVRRVMARDGVKMDQLMSLIETVRRNLG